MLIIPTLMKIYSNMQSNLILKSAIEFACVQFYIMHRIPFLLQVCSYFFHFTLFPLLFNRFFLVLI